MTTRDPLADYRHFGITKHRTAREIAWDVAEGAALILAAGALIWIGGM